MRKKQQRFLDNDINRNVVQAGKEIFESVKGGWNKEIFDNDNDIVLELACGRGEYSTGLGAIFPNKNFIGIDIKGNRIWVGSKKARLENLHNVAFLRTQIDHLERFFEPGEFSEIWIVFPDPRPKDSDEHRRLTSPKYLEVYKRLIKPGGWIHLKTDNTSLFDYSVTVLSGRNDIRDLSFTWQLYHSEFAADHHGIKTKYEHQFTAQGEDIKYLKFRFE
ncbi:MAG: tRNA (guanosine(46)-N7)-methyltransferase TrmB [Cyclobacteriaceae bacterium]|nr:tRNA (guanosine(46)-N7)-methyltransferase TrmB [Cyclobacteriaceae bacterium]